jgi:sigma-54 specific flagellar transcriptional regulator A
MARVVESGEPLVCGAGSPLAEAVRLGQQLARTDAAVLLTGERGSGRSAFARALHGRSLRAGGPLLEVDCSAQDAGALERALFGVAGEDPRLSRLSACEGGTLVLDEVDALPLTLQARLLRLLQERRWEQVGSTASIPADVRVIVSTRRDLHSEVAVGRFRRDLHHRLLSCPIHLPPLRERSMDVEPLFLHFWRAAGGNRPVEPSTLAALSRHPWPGNVRELADLATHLARALPNAPTLRVADLPPAIQQAVRTPALTALPSAGPRPEPQRGPSLVPAREPEASLQPRVSDTPVPRPGTPAAPAPEHLEALLKRAGREFQELPVDLPGLLRSIEQSFIDAALHRTGGNRRAAADLLGLRRTTLVEKLRRQGRRGEPGEGEAAEGGGSEAQED